MRKQKKLLIVILIIVILLTTLTGLAFGAEAGLIKSIGDGGGNVETQSVENFGRAIVSVVKVIGVIVAVVVLLILGVKYMLGSAEERAEYKKTMVPYIVGAVLIFASTTLVGIVYDLADSLNNGGGATASHQAGADYYDQSHYDYLINQYEH